MRVFITGGTGLIGRELVRRLMARGDEALVLTRSPEKALKVASLKNAELVTGDPNRPGDWQQRLAECQGVINLAGENIFGKRWSPAVKQSIRSSRLRATEHVVEAIRAAGSGRPTVLVNGSATGYYGPREDDEQLVESSRPGTDFLATISREWEQAAQPVEALGTRLAIVRTGIVLARGEGALGIMAPIFRIGPGAPVGSSHPLVPATGQQWMSWIHLDDIVGIFLLALDQSAAAGPLNGTAPEPVRNRDFASELSRALRRPYTPWRFALPIGPPDFVLRLALGEVAQVVTAGQRVLPQRPVELGYRFRFPTLRAALNDLFGRR